MELTEFRYYDLCVFYEHNRK